MSHPRTVISRRRVLQSSLITSGVILGGVYSQSAVLGKSRSTLDKLRIAGVGTFNRARANLNDLAHEDIVALSDVDESKLNEAVGRFRGAEKFRDYRIMLDKLSEKIDAVMVGTPDHSHAPAAAMAMRLKKHVYCEKPLTHTVLEARTLAKLAKENKLVTQMGNQIHAGENYRRVVELIRAGAIGKVTTVHVWVNARYTGGKFTTASVCPPNLDWDLFLGPAPERRYSDGVHPFTWRNFWDYGTGALGDFGCHYMDLAHWALDLRNPVKASAEGPPNDPVCPPAWCIARYEYPTRGDQPAVKLTWYDSGKQPEVLPEVQKALPLREDGKPTEFGSGQLFIGDKGMLISDYGRRFLIAGGKPMTFKYEGERIPASIGHHKEWTEAIKTGGTTTCNFDYAGALTESVLLGAVAYKSGEAIEWDSENLRVTNSEKAQSLVHKEYRKGWEL
jgi:predicted dehydrogenase